jgi:hypothetical protein
MRQPCSSTGWTAAYVALWDRAWKNRVFRGNMRLVGAEAWKNKNPVFRGIMGLVEFFAASWGLLGQRLLFICQNS